MAHQSWWEKSRVHQFIQALGAYVVSIVQGTGTTVDNTDPFNPIVSAKISTDASNALSLGTDDGLYATDSGGTVTSVAVSGNNGIGVTGSPITTSGTFTLSLGAITPTSVSTGALTASGAISLPAGSITRANLANGTACSVIGRSANSSGAVADISTATNDRILSRTSNVLSWTQLTAGMVPNALITNAMLRDSAGLSVIGRTAGSSGFPADITSTGARTFLASSASNTALTFRSMEAQDLPGGDWVGVTSGMVTGSSITNLSVDGTWYDTGASTSLNAGTYLITGWIHGLMLISAGTGVLTGRLYNATDSSVVTNSEVCIMSTSFTGVTQATGAFSVILTLAGTKTIRIEASRAAGGTYTTVSTRDNTQGHTAFTYVRLY